jgi:hypothetical protein
MRCFLPLSRGIVLIVPTLFLLAAPSFAQLPTPVSGLVTNLAGQPLPGVSVFSGAGSRPYATTTGADGRFQLASSSNVLHAQLDGYQPVTLLINQAADDLRIQLQPIALSPLTGAILAPPCTPLPPKDRDVLRLGTPGAGLEFTVPRKGWDIRNLGQGDLHEYLVAPRHSHVQLTFWFGANAISLTPEDHFFLESARFAQRALVVADPDAGNPPRSIGIDSSGTFPGGARWRHLATPASGAAYDRVSPADADLFDSIIDTLCVAPEP